MASRTKSFFDADPKNNRRFTHGHGHGQWKRNGSHRPALTEASTNVATPPPPPQPPIPATAEARSKLKAFQFVAAENTTTTTTTPPSVTNPVTTTFPCTPGARLPLADLIGDCDAIINEVPVERSPQEQIGWIPNSSHQLLTPNRRRKRKRAKSSSPPSAAHSSSQSRDGLPSFPDRASMKTPAADPTADLWQRYNGNGRSSGEGSRKLPEISTLAFNASPRPLETPVKGGGGLRRWVSTGNDWPSSKHKKRCSNGRASVNIWQDQTGAGVESVSKSKVAFMVQRIQESLATQRIEQEYEREQEMQQEMEQDLQQEMEQDMQHEREQHVQQDMQQDHAAINLKTKMAPSSSSPPAEMSKKTLMPPPSNISPVTARHVHDIPPPCKEQPISVPPSNSDITPHSSLLRRTESGGISAGSIGDPLHPAASARLHLQSKAPLPAYKRPSITRPPPKVQPIIPPPPISTDLDEFGDAFDLDEDDLTELLSQNPLQQRSLYDIPEHPNPPPALTEVQGAIRQQPITLDDDDDDDGDEFGDDDLDVDSFAQAEFSATQAFRTSPHQRKHTSPKKSSRSTTADTPISSSTTAPGLQRYVVKQVVDSEYTNPKNGRRCEEKILLSEDVRTKLTAAISLRGSWTSTNIAPKNVIHITHLKRQMQAPPSATPPGQIVVDDSETSPLLILHPDHMLSATTVADSFDCVRKAVLQDRVKATSESSKAMVYGSILHEIFQLALSANRWDAAFLEALVERTIESHLEGLWELGMSDTGLAREEVKAKMGELSGWAGIFVAERPGVKALVDERQGEKARMSVSKLIAIEEHVWSPQVGLKGNIDATVQTTVAPSAETGPKAAHMRLITPFEVKTGRTTQSPAHMAQTALYTLLLSDRYDVAVESGILYYLESSAMMRVKPPIVEVRAMIQQRNRVAGHIFSARNPAQEKEDVSSEAPMPVAQSQAIEESGLPPLLRNPFKCGRCYARQSCFAFHALVENGTADTAGMIDDNKKHHSLIWGEAVGHLGLLKNVGGKGDVLKKWFTKWDKLLTFEEGDQARYRKELWTMSSAEREARGRCFGQLVLQKDLTINNSTAASAAATGTVDGVSGSGGKINRFTYVFARAVQASGGSLAEGSALTMGEAVVVSGEQGQWALANGYVTAVSRHDITVAVDRKLGQARQRLPGFDEANNQSLKGTMTVGKEEHLDEIDDETMLYRLDKDEFSNGLALIRNNLVTLMSDDPMHTKLRDGILFGAIPNFEVPTQNKQSTLDATQPKTQLGEMNEDQRSAVVKVLAAQDYALILGMPGTGKTTTIAHIIRALLAEGKSILLTSFTHTAVDNILLKIREIAPKNGILRLGVPSKINKQVQTFCLLASTPRSTFEDIENAYMGTRIVATTCMGTNHAIFQRRTFDVCIVDEASQITLPTILGPLLLARKFVLVGDHYQLPPLVQNKSALEGGLDVSLFRQLSEEQPGSVVALGRQYRMCEEIMSLSNELIYSGQLQCGNESVRKRELELSNPKGLDVYHSTADTICTGEGDSCWLRRATAPRNKVVFANTDPMGPKAMESLIPGGGEGKSLTNALEATLSAQLVLAFLAQGVPAAEIGVMTLYRSQLALLRQMFRKVGIDVAVEIDSADRFQGRDKEVIVLSMVRSNSRGIVGGLLEDWRRVNVAFTRARSKILVVGSRRTLAGNELLGRFLGIVEREGWGLEVPEGAVEEHGGRFGSFVGGEMTGQMMGGEKGDGGRGVEMGPSSSLGRRRTLGDCFGAGNRNSVKESQISGKDGKMMGKKKSPMMTKIISRSASQALGGSKVRKMKERVAVEIFEDLIGEEEEEF